MKRRAIVRILGYDAYGGARSHMNQSQVELHNLAVSLQGTVRKVCHKCTDAKYGSPDEYNRILHSDIVMHARATTLITCFLGQLKTAGPVSNVSSCCWYASGGMYTRQSA